MFRFRSQRLLYITGLKVIRSNPIYTKEYYSLDGPRPMIVQFRPSAPTLVCRPGPGDDWLCFVDDLVGSHPVGWLERA